MNKIISKKLVTLFSLATSLLTPIVTLAAAPPAAFPPFVPGAPIADLPTRINDIIWGIFNFIWPLFAAFAVIMFIYAGFLFLNASGDSGKVRDARQALLWGSIGILVALLSMSIPWFVKTILGL